MCINYIKIGKNNKGGNLNKKKTKRQNGITLVALVNTGSLAQIGTTADKQCNIFDMASNVYEWTTETSHNSDYPCGFRGGNYYSINFYTSSRNGNNTSESNINIGFRSLLFINV